MSPARRRRAVQHLQRVFGVSQRWACQLVGQHRSTQRHQPIEPDRDRALREELRQFSLERRGQSIAIGDRDAVQNQPVDRKLDRSAHEVHPRVSAVASVRSSFAYSFWAALRMCVIVTGPPLSAAIAWTRRLTSA